MRAVWGRVAGDGEGFSSRQLTRFLLSVTAVGGDGFAARKSLGTEGNHSPAADEGEGLSF